MLLRSLMLSRPGLRILSNSYVRVNSIHTYEGSIVDLNSLQSNAATIHALRASGKMNQNAIGEMRDWVQKAGIDQADIDGLKVIIIAGTKGKGSTAAMVASILSKYRLAYGKVPKIGLYTSPHLKSVRERIQIDGEPLPMEEWTEYFYDVWNTLGKTGPDKPVYFRFLTILAFHTFIQECVDVVVLECGVGGEHDSTNIITAPVAAGITSLGIDHIHVLGKTLEEIAWHKAGIFKSGCPAFSVLQENKAIKVLEARAEERAVSSFEVVAESSTLKDVKLGLEGDFQKSNASLAIALANEYLKTQGVDENLNVRLPDEFITGLEEVKWPGRCERRKEHNMEWCLDGGHTAESLKLTGEWYQRIATPVEKHYLVFNQQNRDSVSLLSDLHESLTTSRFDKVIFCTNKTFRDSGYSPELTSINNSSESVDSMVVQKSLAAKWLKLSGQKAQIIESIDEALDMIRQDCGTLQGRCLVTGSLHLVGGVMTVLDKS